VIEGQLTGDFDEDRIGGGVAYSLVSFLITTPLITAGHVYAVMQVGRGEQPSAGASLSQAGGVLIVLSGTVLLSALVTGLATLALIIPGIYVGVRLLVAPQAVVADELGPVEALRRSWDLVRDNWWRVLGIWIMLGLLGAMAGLVLAVPVGALAAVADSGALLVAAQVVVDSITLSFTALGGTLLFFDLRARHEA